MSIKDWTDEELKSTRDNLEEWRKRYHTARSGSKLWLLTAILGALAVSTGVAFIFIDGVTVLSVLLVIMGSFTCYSWYKSEKQKNDNATFLVDIERELKRRKKKAARAKSKGDAAGKPKQKVGDETAEDTSEEKPKKRSKKNADKKAED